MDEEQMKRMFAECMTELPDGGFTASAVSALPPRRRLFPRAVMTVCVAIGVSLALLGIGALARSLSAVEVPPSVALLAYFALLAACGAAAYALAGEWEERISPTITSGGNG